MAEDTLTQEETTTEEVTQTDPEGDGLTNTGEATTAEAHGDVLGL